VQLVQLLPRLSCAVMALGQQQDFLGKPFKQPALQPSQVAHILATQHLLLLL
jgi:hypothetical protein